MLTKLAVLLLALSFCCLSTAGVAEPVQCAQSGGAYA
jgi:hypothetical protein